MLARPPGACLHATPTRIAVVYRRRRRDGQLSLPPFGLVEASIPTAAFTVAKYVWHLFLIPPAEHESNYYGEQQPQPAGVGLN